MYRLCRVSRVASFLAFFAHVPADETARPTGVCVSGRSAIVEILRKAHLHYPTSIYSLLNASHLSLHHAIPFCTFAWLWSYIRCIGRAAAMLRLPVGLTGIGFPWFRGDNDR